MGLLNSKDYSGAYRRTLTKGTKRCVIKDVRETTGKPTDDGKPIMDSTFVSLQLAEPAKTVDGDEVEAGAVFDVVFNTCADTAGDTKLDTMNRISNERFRELVIAGLGLAANTKDAAEQLEKRGGITAILGKEIVVDWSPTKKGMNAVDKFSAVPSA